MAANSVRVQEGVYVSTVIVPVQMLATWLYVVAC